MRQKSRSTISDLARVAGVSISTVDRVLNARDPVRSMTAERVLRAAEEIDFYATGRLRQQLGADLPQRNFGFLLQSEAKPFYRNVGQALVGAVAAIAGPRSTAHVDYLTDLSAQNFAQRMLKLGREVEALAVVAAEHPRITNTIEKLSDEGVPVYALISDLSATARAGYVGLDSWKAGRTAGWAISGLCKAPGKVGLMLGSHRYRCQESYEMGFRSYFRERAPDFTLLEPRNTMEDARLAYENVMDLIRRNKDLAGLFVGGGGIEGILAALREFDPEKRIVTVGLDLTDEIRLALIDGTLDMVISHPIERMARELIEAMCRGGAGIHEVLLPFDIHTRENV